MTVAWILLSMKARKSGNCKSRIYSDTLLKVKQRNVRVYLILILPEKFDFWMQRCRRPYWQVLPLEKIFLLSRNPMCHKVRLFGVSLCLGGYFVEWFLFFNSQSEISNRISVRQPWPLSVLRIGYCRLPRNFEFL